MVDDATIREKAYELWEQAGRPEGDELMFWDQAQKKLQAEQPPPNADMLDSSQGADPGSVLPEP